MRWHVDASLAWTIVMTSMLSQPVNYYIRNIFLAIGFAGRILEGIGAGMVQTGGKENL